MSIARCLITGLLLVTFSISYMQRAVARLWKPAPAQEALEYGTIQDKRSDSELVLLIWFAPEAFESTRENEPLIALLREYVVVVVAHLHMSDFGEMTFETPADIVVRTSKGETRYPIPSESLPPLLIGLLSAIKAIAAQSMGMLGQNATTFVFEATDIASCEKGIFWIGYSRVEYDFETPIPGCQ